MATGHVKILRRTSFQLHLATAVDFGRVRLWGTIGWIAAAWPFVFILADWTKIPALGDVSFIDWLGKVLGTSKDPSGPAFISSAGNAFVAAGVASLALAAFSLFLP